MKLIQYLSYACLVTVLVAPVLYFSDVLTKDVMKSSLLAGTILWFITATLSAKKGE
jgi:hypothetical protein